MHRLTILLTSLLLFSLTCSAETLRFQGKLDGVQTTGSAKIDLDDLSMQLVAGDTTRSLRGYPIEHGEYLFVEPSASAGLTGSLSQVVPTGKQRAVVVAEVLNVRPAPTLDSVPLRQAAGGDPLPLSGVTNDPWLQLADGGWVHGASKYVRVEDTFEADSISSEGMALKLRPNSAGYFGTVKGSTDVLRFVRVVANGAPRVLLIPTIRYTEKEQRTLKHYALKLKRYYAQRGIESDLHQAESAVGVINYLGDAALAGKRYSRVIWIGHGGWD